MKIYYDHNIIEDKEIPEKLLKINSHLATKMSIFESFCDTIKDAPKINPKQEELSDYQNKNKILLTFDDGYKSFLNNILPLLEKHNIPSLLFITTDFIENKIKPWEVEIFQIIDEKEEIVDLNFKKRE